MTKIAATIADATTPTAEADLEADILRLLQQVLAANSSADLAPIAARPVDHRIRKAIGLMRADPRKPQCPDNLAQSVGLSRSHFYEQFSASMGTTPSVYSDTLRVEYAIEQLIGSDRPASEIALDLGFSAPSHFSRFFKNKIGFAPREYRKVAQNIIPDEDYFAKPTPTKGPREWCAVVAKRRATNTTRQPANFRSFTEQQSRNNATTPEWPRRDIDVDFARDNARKRLCCHCDRPPASVPIF